MNEENDACVSLGNDGPMYVCFFYFIYYFFLYNVVVMSESVYELQSLFDVVVDWYSRDFNVRFSSDKSKVMIADKSENERNLVWRLGENELQDKCR